MKRWAALLMIVAAAVAALVVTQRRRVEAPVGPQAVLNAIAESERDATRVPAHMTRISDDEEIRAGDVIAGAQSARTKPTAEDAAVEAYVAQVGQRLIPYTTRKLPYKFHYIPSAGFVNAYALPGGHVFIGAGLMALMDSEDELASVLGHEIEHVDRYHCVERLQTEATLRKLSLAGAIASIPVALFQMGYTKNQEMEADHDGLYLAYRAGYSPTGALRMFEAFARFEGRASGKRAGSPADEAARVAGELLSGYFRSHPFSHERAEAARKLISEQNWPPRPEHDIGVDCRVARKELEARRTRHAGGSRDTQKEAPCRVHARISPPLKPPSSPKAAIRGDHEGPH